MLTILYQTLYVGVVYRLGLCGS